MNLQAATPQRSSARIRFYPDYRAMPSCTSGKPLRLLLGAMIAPLACLFVAPSSVQAGCSRYVTHPSGYERFAERLRSGADDGGGDNGGWDAHGDIETHAPLCRATDKPIAGLIRDLKQRGMLDETLVVWSSEFGRSPWSQNTTGRDHNPRGYTAWIAGGGIKGGVVHGATDDVGYKAVENPHYYSDLHATILHQLGIDHAKMEIPVLGRTMRLVEISPGDSKGPIKEIIN